LSISFGILSTYPPTQCGIASFSASLAGALDADGNTVGVVRVVDGTHPTEGMKRAADTKLADGTKPADNARVVHRLVLGSRASSLAAARVLSGFDVAVVQHEYGLYGGADGEDLLDLMDEIDTRVVVVTHTVLASPSRHQREVLRRVTDRADAVVTMTDTAQWRLIDGYDVDQRKVVVIPHGAVTASAAKVGVRRPGPPRLLTWGLIGPGKGIEKMIDALALLRAMDTPPHYHVVGQTHPRVFERQGEAYRSALKCHAVDRGVSDLVVFHSAYLDSAELRRVVEDADMVVLPYESREQVTSGVLIEAVAARKPVVATAFPHAVELLATGAGVVVPHESPRALAAAIRRVILEPGLAASMREHAGVVAAGLRWSEVAARYRDLATDLVMASATMVV
jgi:polysaccharide biosynthesis protein PslF